MTSDKVREILLSLPKENGFMRHFLRIVRPLENGLFEMEDTSNEWYLIGSLDEAIDFLMDAQAILTPAEQKKFLQNKFC